MDIITAEQAREITNSYIPYEIKSTMEYVMEDIKDSANYGNDMTEFHDSLTPCTYLEVIKSDKFKKYIESLGYKYKFNSEEKWGCYSEWVTISW